MYKPNSKLEKVLVAAILTSFAIWGLAFIYRTSFIAVDGKRYFCLFDDAMISMRYAWNFSHGLGLVWNPGEHVEGYTNLLMTLLMSLFTLVFDKPTAALAVQVSGVVVVLAVSVVSMRISGHITRDENLQRRALVRILSLLCVLSYYPLAYWSLMGMETGLLTLLLLTSILLAFDYMQDKNPARLLAVGGCSGLAFLTRNDSVILSSLIWLYVAWGISKPTVDRKSLRWLLLAVGLFTLFVVGQFSFRYLYYGAPLPNTYTLKLADWPLSARIANGAAFISPFLVETAPLLCLATMSLLFDFQSVRLLLLALVFSAISYQIYVGGDAWNYWRMLSPVMPLVIILFVSALNTIAPAIYPFFNPIFQRKLVAEVMIAGLALIGLVVADARFLPEIVRRKPYTVDYHQDNVNAAIVIDQLTTNEASVGVFFGGAIPYFTGRKAVDFLGKSDRYIAQLPPDTSGAVGWFGMKSLPGHNKYDLTYSIQVLQPTYVQGFQWGMQDLSQWAKTKYVQVEYKGVSVFLLKDSPFVLWNRITTP